MQIGKCNGENSAPKWWTEVWGSSSSLNIQHASQDAMFLEKYSPKGRKEFNKTEQLTHTQKSNREFSQSDSTRVSGSQTEKDLSIPLPVHFFLFYF